jgi:hypothetical protein
MTGTEEVDALIVFAHLKSQSGQGIFSDALHSWYSARKHRAARLKTETVGRYLHPCCVSVYCLSLLNHQAGGDLHIQVFFCGFFCFLAGVDMKV